MDKINPMHRKKFELKQLVRNKSTDTGLLRMIWSRWRNSGQKKAPIPWRPSYIR